MLDFCQAAFFQGDLFSRRDSFKAEFFNAYCSLPSGSVKHVSFQLSAFDYFKNETLQKIETVGYGECNYDIAEPDWKCWNQYFFS